MKFKYSSMTLDLTQAKIRLSVLNVSSHLAKVSTYLGLIWTIAITLESGFVTTIQLMKEFKYHTKQRNSSTLKDIQFPRVDMKKSKIILISPSYKSTTLMLWLRKISAFMNSLFLKDKSILCTTPSATPSLWTRCSREDWTTAFGKIYSASRIYTIFIMDMKDHTCKENP